jgi:hypothetical protein
MRASLIGAQKPDWVHKADTTVSSCSYLISQWDQMTHPNLHPLASNGCQLVGVKEHKSATPSSAAESQTHVHTGSRATMSPVVTGPQPASPGLRRYQTLTDQSDPDPYPSLGSSAYPCLGRLDSIAIWSAPNMLSPAPYFPSGRATQRLAALAEDRVLS